MTHIGEGVSRVEDALPGKINDEVWKNRYNKLKCQWISKYRKLNQT